MGANLGAFWDEMSPSDHSVQIYDTDESLLEALESFVAGGLRHGECAVVIATPEHRIALQRRLATRDIDLWDATARNQYIPLDADATLLEFMRDEWPDDRLFSFCARNLITRARADGRPVRAFGEMVAILWARGLAGAALRVEHLWHQLCHEEGFPLFCAYPRHSFRPDAPFSLEEVCATHDRQIGGTL